MSKDKQIIATDITGFAVTVTPAAIALRDKLLMESGFIDADFIKDEEGMKEAVRITGQLKGFNSEIKKTREAVKRPILDAGILIDDTAKAAMVKTLPEVERIERLIGALQAERARAAEAERQRLFAIQQAEARRIQAEADAKQREIDEANRKAAEATSEADAAAAQAEVERLEAEEFERSLEASLQAAEEAPVSVHIPEIIKGTSTRTKYIFEVTDIHALYAWDRQYVKMDVDRAQLNGRINLANPGVDIFNIPGIKVTEDTKSTVKTTRILPIIEQ